MSEFVLRPYTSDDLDAAVALSRAVAWPHRREDWAILAEVSMGVVAVSDGRVVGTAFTTPYGPEAATVNMIIVDERLRGRGLGRRLVEAAMALAGDRRLCLFATDEGLPLYRKLGFVETGEIVQHQGPAAEVAAPEGVEDATPDDRDAILALDRAAYGADRSALLSRFLEIGTPVLTRQDGAVSGFALRRPFGRGEVVGPVVAPDAETAKRLIAAHLSARPGAFLRMDTTFDSGLGPWLAGQGLAHTGGGVAMIQAGAPLAASSGPKIFALASQAFG